VRQATRERLLIERLITVNDKEKMKDYLTKYFNKSEVDLKKDVDEFRNTLKDLLREIIEEGI